MAIKVITDKDTPNIGRIKINENFTEVDTRITNIVATGSLKYLGTWDASTNTPTLYSNGDVNHLSAHYYKVGVAGATSLDGITDWKVGDWVVYNGSAWEKIDQTETVSSVNGQVGDVVIDTSAASVTVTDANNHFATSTVEDVLDEVGSGLSSKLNSAGGTMTGNINFSITNVNAATSGITWSGLTDTHRIYTEEYAGGEGTRLVIQNEDNGNTDYTLFRNRAGTTTNNILELRHTYINSLQPVQVNGVEVVNSLGNISSADRIPVLDASKITTGIFDIARIPTGTTATTVAFGNHNHTLDSLSNTTVTSIAAGELLKWSGTAWINNTLAEAGIEPAFTKNTGFNLSLGTTAGTVSEGDHTHTLTAITDSGTAASKNVPATGNAATTEVVLGDDTRLSDARTPTTHTHVRTDITDLNPSIATKTTAYTVVEADNGSVIEVDATAASVTITFPTGLSDGFSVTILKIESSANLVTLAADTGATITGSATSLPSQWDKAYVYRKTGDAYTAI